MGRKPRAQTAGLALALLAAPQPVLAQRTQENAVASSDDAFGTQVGQEVTGIYTDADTRGFSPTKAGNIRIDGIYYDPVGLLPSRLRSGTTIRVGFAAESYPFQAPTGIAEYRFRPWPEKRGLSLGFSRTPFWGSIMEVDARIPIVKDHIGLTGGMAAARQTLSDGTHNSAASVTVRPIFRYAGAEFAPYFVIGRYTSNYTHPLAVVTGDTLPRFPRKKYYLGQRWANGRYDNVHRGATLKAPITDNLSLRAGLFYSQADRDANYNELFLIGSASGLAVHRLIADPVQRLRSTSGEAQLAWRLGEGRTQHRFIIGYRARKRVTDSGGSDIRNLGQVPFGERNRVPEPNFSFSPVNTGVVRQSSLLLGYIGRIENVGRLNIGLQKNRYRATVREGRTGLLNRTSANPLLYNVSLGVDLTHALSFYGAHERGLEDSGVAPENAVNRNAQLPAARSTQYEGGLRWKFQGGQLVVSGFQISKPYFSFDAGNAFTRAGTVRHRGLEASMAGHFGNRLNIVAGAVAIKARVSGPARDAGLVGARPAGTPSLYARLDVNYHTDIFGGLTPTASVIYTGRRALGSRPLPSLGGKQLMLPGAATLDLGLRQQFKFGGTPVSIRALLSNVLDQKAWKVVAPNTMYPDERRRFMLVLAADF